MLIIGIDDAGRGPLIGPMILAGVLLDKNSELVLQKNGISDSKLIPHKTRIKMAKLIKETTFSHKISKTSPIQIDEALSSGINLNKLEAMKTAEIINSLNSGKDKIKVVIDCPSVNISAWSKTLLDYIENPKNLTIVCEHKADLNHVAVSAASIIAKVAREEEVEKLKKEFGEIGSGYPSDPITKDFLKKHGKELENSGIFRKSWSTWKRLFPDKKQSSLKDF